MQAQENFKAAMLAAGITPPDCIDASGTVKRFSTNGRASSDKAGWYVFYDDGFSAGAFGCFRQGISVNWSSKPEQELTDAEKKAYAEKIKLARAAKKAEEKKRHQDAQERAEIIWEAATPAAEHQYLIDKHVQSHGLRVGRWTKTDEETGEVYFDCPDALLVPIKEGKRIVSLQAIYPTKIGGRNKDFLRGGKLRGCFFTIGKPKAGDPIYMTEGYATGATIHELTGCAVVVCFAANNLALVAVKLRESFADFDIIIAADNDRFTDGNPGIKAAKDAARQAKAHVVAPQFNGDGGTDFNDLFLSDGADVAREQLKKPDYLNSTDEKSPAPEESTKSDHMPDAGDMVGEAKKTTDALPINCISVDLATPLPDVGGGKTPKPRSTIENLREICRRLGVVVRYNMIRKEEEIIIPGEAFSIDNEANASLAWLMSWCARFEMPLGQIGDFITYMADQNQYNPVANWITSKPWDGVSRIAEFFATIESEDEALKTILMHRWMVSAVAAIFRPEGVSAHGVLVIQGEQYLGKTKWFKSLVPASLKVIQDGVQLDPKDKDSVEQAISNWLVELGELDATFRKSDIAQLKAFLTRDKDVLRKAYARKKSTFARRTVFFGSVNPEQYLNDPTGNRRYWTIAAKRMHADHGLDMQQVWAEFYEIYKGGESFYLSHDELAALNQNNDDHQTLDPIQERIQTKLDWQAPELSWVWMSATDILSAVGVDRQSKADVTATAIYIKKLNGNRKKRSGQSRLLLCPPLVVR